jgi:hypothetical protein
MTLGKIFISPPKKSKRIRQHSKSCHDCSVWRFDVDDYAGTSWADKSWRHDANIEDYIELDNSEDLEHGDFYLQVTTGC